MPGSLARPRVAVLLLCNMFFLAVTTDVRAQCSARDVLQQHLTLRTAHSVPRSQSRVNSPAEVWKTIRIGTYADPLALRNALSDIGCTVGGSAAEILGRPAFTLSPETTDVELVAVSAAELGFLTETASLGQIYDRAKQLGLELAAAEIAPQLRLQYFDQPIGEFLIIAMEPIKTWNGEPVILTVANGGAGLSLIGQEGFAHVELPVTSHFVFVRTREAVRAGDFPGPWLEVTQEIRDILTLNKVSACTQAAARASSQNPGEYLLYCTSDEKLWTSWHIQAGARFVRGPGKLLEGIAPPDGY